MKDAPSPSFIDVQKLRVGMFIHLDVGWMAHPFPLSSFKLTTSEQVTQVQGLGKTRIRWSPEKSDLPLDEAPLPSDAEGSLVPGGEVEGPGGVWVPGLGRVAAPAVADVAEARRARLRREALHDSRARAQSCERQFLEVSRACRQASDLAFSRPEEGRLQTEQLTRALVDKLMGEQEMCIRLLTEAAGDKASMHAVNVTVISLLMGRTFGLSDEDMMDMGVGALLHDIGKLDLPDRVRHREENFTTAETQFYQEHVAHGVAIARKMGLKPGASLVIAQHHEHADGSGFPLKLNSDRMSTAARIVSLVNRYDNMCNPHVPSRAVTPHEALSLLFAQGKNRYDTAILNAFIRMMGVYPPGSTVQLTDDRYALVMSVNSSRPLRPTVLVHDPSTPRDEALLLDLEQAAPLGIRRSLKPHALPPDAFVYLSPRPRIAYFFEPHAEWVGEEELV